MNVKERIRMILLLEEMKKSRRKADKFGLIDCSKLKETNNGSDYSSNDRHL